MASVFISYAREDRPLIQTLAERLSEKSCSVWWDQAIAPGDQWDREIEQQLNSASCVVVVWSAASVDSEYVRSEASQALKCGTLFPVAVDETTPPLEFSKRQNAVLRTGPGFETTVQALIEAILARVLGRQRAAVAGLPINDWRTSGGFRDDDPLLVQLPPEPIAGKSRYEMCRMVIDRRAGSDKRVAEAFEGRARSVFEAFALPGASGKEPDQRDAETALLLAHELVRRYSAFGRPLRDARVRSTTYPANKKQQKRTPARPEIPSYFSRVYLNTVNTFVKDIVNLIANDDSKAKELGVVAREADLAAATIELIRSPKLELSRNPGTYFAGPEVHAAYMLGRLTKHVAVMKPAEALAGFERKIDGRLASLTDGDAGGDTARRLRLMRRTAILSQAMLDSPPALSRYLFLLQNNALEMDANAGFHLEYYCDQQRDTQLPLCSRDDGRSCQNTVRHLCHSLDRAVAAGWRESANPLLLVEAYTLATVVARRLHGEFDSQARAALPTIERVHAATEDEDTQVFLRLLLDGASSGADFAAREFGRFMAAKNAPRNGWVKRDIRFPETVGAHTASVIWLCRLLPRYEGSTVNYSRVRRMLEIHDLAEGITSDIVASNKSQDSAAERRERLLMRRFSWLGLYLRPQVDFVDAYELYQEFTKQSTRESQIARDLDRVDIVMQGLSLMRNSAEFDTSEVRSMINRTENEILTKEVKTILPAVRLMQVLSMESFSTTPDCELKRYYFPIPNAA